LNLGGSFIVPVSADSLHSVSIGLQMGMTHRNIDYSDLNFDAQYDGLVFNPNLATGESFARDSRTYFDLHLGASWFYQRNKREKYTAGFGLYNLTTPEQSYFDAAVPLNSRLNIHASAEIAVAEDWDIMPSILFMSQDNYREFVIGGSARKILLKEAGLLRTVYGGFYFRTRDAGYLLAGVDYDEWRVGLSYDFNLSDLRPASNGRGGLELAVIYILREFKPQLTTKRLCPEFL
jgi:type IX secretion system PorP/SprF family membrane protein